MHSSTRARRFRNRGTGSRDARSARSAVQFESLEGRRLFAAGGLDWSTFIGGSGDDSVTDVVAAPDGSGDVIVTGASHSENFPPGGGTRPEGASAYVARLSADGTRLVYVTFLTGSATPEYIAVGRDGSVAVVGGGAGEDFETTPGAYRSETGDLFVAKLDPNGNIAFAAVVDGDPGDGSSGVGVDPAGGVVVTGYTSDPNFPTTAGAFDRVLNAGDAEDEFGESDAFVSRLSPDGSRLTYSTFLGGEGDDEATGVVVDPRGFVTVVGETNPLFEDETPGGGLEFEGERFPTTAGAFQREFQGQEDGFVARLKLDGGGAGDLRYGTIFGSAGEDVVQGVAFDPDDTNKVVVTSRTDGWNWPTTRGAYQRTRVLPEQSGDPDLGVTAFRFFQSRGGRLVWSTLHGAISGYLYGSDVDIDRSGNVVIAGSTEVTQGADLVRPTTQGAFDHTPGTGGAFLTRLSPGGQRLLYETFVDHASIGSEPRVAVVGPDSAVIAGTTFGFDFPTTPGSLDPVLNEGELVSHEPDDGYVARFTFAPMDPSDTTAAAPTLLSPRNGARFPSVFETENHLASVTFDWTDVSDPSGVQLYELEISHNAQFVVHSEVDNNKRMLIRVEESEAEVFHQFHGDTLYWRVRTLDNAGNFSRWSSGRQIHVGPVEAPRLAAMFVTPTGVIAGRNATGTILLEGVAPAGGTTLTLSSSDPDIAGVPETVTVPAGRSSVSFPITTRAVATATPVWIQAELGEDDWSAPVLWIDPAEGMVPPPAGTKTYQAESSTRRGPVVSARHRGFTGGGYLDFQNARGDFAEFEVQAAAAGQHTLKLRYANGGSATRTMALTVNGAARAGGVAFAPTGSWSEWREVSIVVQLTAGNNRIRLTATGESGPNLDALTVTR